MQVKENTPRVMIPRAARLWSSKTEEELDNLKIGDTIVVEVKVINQIGDEVEVELEGERFTVPLADCLEVER